MSRARKQRRAAGARPAPTGDRRPAALHPGPRARSPLLPALALALVVTGGWAWSNSLDGVLVLDDVQAIAANRTIRSLWPLPGPLRPPSGTSVSARPVANLSFAVNYALAPRDARDGFIVPPTGFPEAESVAARVRRNLWGYHLGNLLIHLAAGLALLGVVRRTLLSERLAARFAEPTATWLAFVVAAVWLVHPLQTESVTYVVQRVESLMGLFYLLTLYCAIRACEGRRAGAWTAAAVAACALGMGTKEVMVTAPIVAWLWAFVFASPETRGRRWPLWVGLAASWGVLGLALTLDVRGPSIDLRGATVWRYLLTQAEIIAHYLRLAVWPRPLVFLYSWPLVTTWTAVLGPLVLVGGLAVVTVVGVARRHPAAFAGAAFFLILAPSSSLLPIVTETAAEHRMYLPLAAVVSLAAVGAFFLGRAAGRGVVRDPARGARLGRTAAALVSTAIALALALATQARNRDYRSEEALWRDTVEKQPTNQRAHVGYATALSTMGRLDEAEAHFRQAVDLGPQDPVAHTRLGMVLAAKGSLDAAAPFLERALALQPDDIDAHRTLGHIYGIQRRDRAAARHLGRALEAQPNSLPVLSEMAGLLADSSDPTVQDPRRAVALAEHAASLTSRQNPMLLEVLAVAYAGAGRNEEAVSAVREALVLARAHGDQELVARLEARERAYGAQAAGALVPTKPGP